MTTDQPPKTTQNNEGNNSKLSLANPIERLEKTGSHDEFFKEFLSDPDKARRFLAWILGRYDEPLPIDLALLQSEPVAMRNNELKNLFADMLFKAPVQTTAPDGSAQEVPVYIFFLLEHKSFNDPMTVLQVLQYQVGIWTRNDKERTRNKQPRLPIPFILPIIVHHGAGRFTSATNLRDMIVPMRGLESFLPSFPCELIDIGTMEELDYPTDWDLQVFCLALKLLSSQDIFRDIDEIISKVRPYFADEANRHFIEILTLYILKNNPIYQGDDCKKMRELMSQADNNETVEAFEPWWMKARNKVRDEAREEGILLGRKKALLVILKVRFGAVSPAIEEAINSVSSVSVLDELISYASCAANLEEFSAHLP